VIAEIPLKKKKFRVKGFLIARILLWKEEFVKKAPWKPKSHRQRNSHRKGLRQQVMAQIPSSRGFPPKRLEITTSCGLKSHPQGDSHRKGSRQQWVVAWVSIMIINGDGSQVNVCAGCLKISWHDFMKIFLRRICSDKRARGSCENS
jgi:hypothetical protein